MDDIADLQGIRSQVFKLLHFIGRDRAYEFGIVGVKILSFAFVKTPRTGRFDQPRTRENR